MVKFGVEFEMSVEFLNSSFITPFKDSMRTIGEIGTDGSVEAGYDDESFAWDEDDFPSTSNEEWEVRTKVYSSVKKFMMDINNAFFKIPHPKKKGEFVKLSINEHDASSEIVVHFNDSTGTHIHVSSIMDGRITADRKIINNKVFLDEVFKYINKNIKYPTIKKDLIREYADDKAPIWEKYRPINITNSLGTLEFRSFNLHGIKTNEFLDAMKHMITLMLKSLEYVFDNYKSLKLLGDKSNITDTLKAIDEGNLEWEDMDDDYGDYDEQKGNLRNQLIVTTLKEHAKNIDKLLTLKKLSKKQLPEYPLAKKLSTAYKIFIREELED